MSRLIPVCAVDALPPGSRQVVEVDAYDEALVLNVNGTVYAMSNICAHEGAALQRGYVEGTVLYCPLHRWGFALTSGQCVDDATLCARTYPVEMRDGQLLLRVP